MESSKSWDVIRSATNICPNVWIAAVLETKHCTQSTSPTHFQYFYYFRKQYCSRKPLKWMFFHDRTRISGKGRPFKKSIETLQKHMENESHSTSLRNKFDYLLVLRKSSLTHWHHVPVGCVKCINCIFEAKSIWGSFEFEKPGCTCPNPASCKLPRIIFPNPMSTRDGWEDLHLSIRSSHTHTHTHTYLWPSLKASHMVLLRQPLFYAIQLFFRSIFNQIRNPFIKSGNPR